MFSIFKRKRPQEPAAPEAAPAAPAAAETPPAGARVDAPATPVADTPATNAPATDASAADAAPAMPDVAGLQDSTLAAPDAPAGYVEPIAEPDVPLVPEVPVMGALPVAPEPEPVPAEPAPADQAPAAAAKKSWLSRLKQGLSRTGQSIGGLFVGVKVDEALFEDLESALIMADAGMEATGRLIAALRARVRKDRIEDAGQVKAALRDLLAEHLAPLEKSFPLGSVQPLVVMIAGVNGAGKTTSIGKLANTFQRQGASVLLAAGDTFRAAAREQLVEWGARNNVTVIAQDGGDPAAVAFDAVNAGRARQAGVVMIDTAGRLPTQLHLMEELKKIRRVIGKADPAAPHEVLLVIDGNTGQNAIAQIRAFDAAIGLTGLVVTKLDGTAKGGTLAAVAAGSQGVRPIPVYWIGVGEGLDDLQPFVAREFAAALVA
ncbi:signal recognition particle-docking protein FtsY [Candidimonas humi]|jgi:fused signal recognition particle receptor|uniref:Signal recognition particle receptor FtsY n=1 Tax=Candidimonas humi TaxID=683355 RepID=A0ABV8P167_9BURK